MNSYQAASVIGIGLAQDKILGQKPPDFTMDNENIQNRWEYVADIDETDD